LTYKQLIPFSGEQALVIEPFLSVIRHEFKLNSNYGTYKDNDDGAGLGVDVTWYILRQLGVYAGVKAESYNGDGDTDSSEAKSHVGVSYFLNENIRLGGELISVSGEADEFEGDSEYEGGGVEFNAAARF